MFVILLTSVLITLTDIGSTSIMDILANLRKLILPSMEIADSRLSPYHPYTTALLQKHSNSTSELPPDIRLSMDISIMSNSDMMIRPSLELKQASDNSLDHSLNLTSSRFTTKPLKSRENKDSSRDGDHSIVSNGTEIMMEHSNGLPMDGLRLKEVLELITNSSESPLTRTQSEMLNISEIDP